MVKWESNSVLSSIIFNMKSDKKFLKLFNDDFFKVIKKMEDNSVTHTITSPPYNMNLRVSNNKYKSRQIVKELSSKYEGFDDNLSMDEYFNFTKKTLTELLRVTSGYVFYNVQFITGNKRALFKIIGEFNENIKEIIIWDKKNGQPAIASGVLNSQYEIIIVLTKDVNDSMQRQFKKANFGRGTLSNVWNLGRGKSKIKGHGATFPTSLVEEILDNFAQDGDIIFDPFLGTGTAADVSITKGYNFIGCEILESYFEKAAADAIKIAKERNYDIRII